MTRFLILSILSLGLVSQVEASPLKQVRGKHQVVDLMPRVCSTPEQAKCGVPAKYPLAFSQLTFSHAEKNFKRTVRTNAKGRFNLRLPVGLYFVESGKAERDSVKVKSRGANRFTINMKVY